MNELISEVGFSLPRRVRLVDLLAIVRVEGLVVGDLVVDLPKLVEVVSWHGWPLGRFLELAGLRV